MGSNLILFNKPYRVLSQFSQSGDKKTLKDFISMPKIYPAGRLDFDSEGLLLLTDNGQLQHRIAHPSKKLSKTYWVQVDGDIDQYAISALKQGVSLKDGITRKAKVQKIQAPKLWDRTPPVRYRATIPTSWIEITISEGKNRQVRRMTAHVGYPTLRLVRTTIGPWQLNHLTPGQYQAVQVS